MSTLITEDLVLLDISVGSREEVTNLLAAKLADAGRVKDLDAFLADVRAREEQMPTGLPGGIGIPHARSTQVTEPTLGFARVPGGVDFGAEDGPATLVFLIAAPDGSGSDHLQILAALARRLVNAQFTQGLRDAASPTEVVDLVTREVVVR